ncbi:MAG: hypothetical protein JWN44_5725 [Myxococcales bacterium]|nr:hypothetical protein [Myxococcales bacterium]
MQAGALVALGDAWALRHAWGSVGEKLALAVGVAALVVGAAVALVPWLHALVARDGKWALLAAALAGPLVGWPLGATATATRLLGAPAAGIVASLAVAAALTATALLARGDARFVATRSFATRSVATRFVATRSALRFALRSGATRYALAAVGAAALVAQLALPSRLYPSLRMALLVGSVVALTAALRHRHRPDPDADPAPSRAVVATLALAAALLLAGRVLIGVSANTRFIAHAQAPAAGFVLDALPSLRAAEPLAHADALPAAHPAALDLDLPGDAHLVLVTVDALRADRLRERLMPALTALAAHGVRATHAYAAAPSTASSITSLLTARPPTRLEGRPPSLGERLRSAGWYTACFYPAGLFFDGGGPLKPYAEAHFGFRWADTRTLPAEALTDVVLGHAQEVVARGEPRSFFWLHYFDPHEPYDAHELPADAPPEARYDAEVRAVDRALGRLVAGLAVFERPVIVVITADHGEEFGEHGGAYHGSSLYDEQLRVPLVIARLDGGAARLDAAAARVIDAPVSLVDLVPALLGEPSRDGDLLAAVDSRRMLVRGSWKLIRDLRREVDELYDLAHDPAEQHNVVDAHEAVADTLRRALETRLDHTSAAQLITTLGDGAQSSVVRADAARQLGAREAYAAAEPLRDALDDGDASVRAEAALALAQLTDRRAGPPLRALLDDPRWGDRAAVMLGRLRDPAAARRLVRICRRSLAIGDSAEAAFRREAAHYLGFVGGSDAVDALLFAAEDPRVRGSAYVAIGRIAGRTRDGRAARLLRDRFAVEERTDARKDLGTALELAATPK